ncbi:lipocalin family protein [Capnocytophaga sp. oral taxon 338]|uniref:lipocalin family protein n=1 Tax=Capnocytophaga sp. oral taxon 338 TaxID=710239 RepID=UPI000202DBCF|nr:lipocalin family protein [Capnocytophaga sp. oral taxon 338]EGD33879.1 hypothetical protein HMPREF9071_1596 [Capnocytophaga sp. oral taxon 338 str. F0234]
MGNIFKAVLVAIAFFVMSCGKSDNFDPKDLVGSTWYLESVTFGDTSYHISNCAKESKIVFTDTEYTKTEYAGTDGNCTPSNKQVGTYTISGNTILVKYGYNFNTNAEPKITISGKKLTLSEYKKGNTGKETPLIKVFVRR